MNSAASLKAATIYNAVNNDSVPGEPVLQVSPASSSPQLTGAGEWTFRICPTDLEFSPVLARWASQRRKGRAAVRYAHDDRGQWGDATFRDAFTPRAGPSSPTTPTSRHVRERQHARPVPHPRLPRGADALVIGGQAPRG